MTLRQLPFLALLAALAGCGASSRDTVRTCLLPTDCDPGSSCVQGACQASTPPVADFTVPAGLLTHRAVTLASTAHDPDPGHTLATQAWTVEPALGGCAPDLEGEDTATLQLIFWCAGTYQVTLTVTDSTGLAGAPATRTLAVAALTDPPSVTATGALAVDHACAGAPLQCGLASPAALSATGHSPTGAALTYRWTALPPDPSRAGATPVFTPSATSAAPSLDLRTAGGALSGAWTVRVRVTDPQGNLAQALVPLTVNNRPPSIAAPPLSLDHRYEGGAYRVDATLSLPMSDPDGDPLEASATLVEPAGSGCDAAFDLVSPGAGALSLACPAGAGLMGSGRLLRLAARDVNGASATAELPVQVLNRVPVLQPAAGAGVTELALDHAVGPCPLGAGRCFQVTSTNPFAAVDPDGDPVASITLLPTVDPARTASVAEVGSGSGAGSVRFSTPVERPAEFRSAAGASGFRVTATATDGFGASLPVELPVRVLNRAPVAAFLVPAATVAHRYEALASAYLADATLSSFSDPDGDPLADAGSGDGADCADVTISPDGVATVTCRHSVPYAATYPTLAGFPGDHPVAAAVSDGWESASATTTVTITNRPPTVPAYTGAAESCACICASWEVDAPTICAVEPRWKADLTNVPFPSRPADADGDLLAATFSPATGLGAATVVATPDACTTTFSGLSVPVTVEVTVNDGVSQATASWTINRVICSKEGAVCTNPRPRR